MIKKYTLFIVGRRFPLSLKLNSVYKFFSVFKYNAVKSCKLQKFLF